MTALRMRMQAATSTASALSRSAWQKVRMLAVSARSLCNEAICRVRVLSLKLWTRSRSAASQQTGGLLRKYAALLVALVGGSLIVNAAIEMYYSYGESRQALIAVQREKAQGAAAVIEQFVKEIEGQVGWATGFLPAGSGLEQRRFDFLRRSRRWNLLCDSWGSWSRC